MQKKFVPNDFVKQQIQDGIEKRTELADYYKYFKLDDLILQIKKEIYQEVSEEIQSRINQGHKPESLPNIVEKSDQQFLELYKKMVSNIDQEIQKDKKKQNYDFNDLYFFDSSIIHEKIKLKKIFSRNDNLRIKILRSFYVLSKNKSYLMVRDRIVKSQLTYIIEKAAQLFEFKEIAEVQKQAVSTLTKNIQTQNFTDFGSYLDVLSPLTKLEPWKQKQILQILYECILEFLKYAFIMFDKKIAVYVLIKTDVELKQFVKQQRDSGNLVYQEINDNVIEMFDTFYQQEKELIDNTKNPHKFIIQDKTGKDHEYTIDLTDKELLNRGLKHVVDYIAKKENIFQIINNVQNYNQIDMKLFDDDYKQRMKYYLQISFSPFSQFIINYQKQYTDIQIQDYFTNFLKDFIMNLDLGKLITDTSQGITEIKKQIGEIGKNLGGNKEQFEKHFSDAVSGVLSGQMNVQQLSKLAEEFKQKTESQNVQGNIETKIEQNEEEKTL